MKSIWTRGKDSVVIDEHEIVYKIQTGHDQFTEDRKSIPYGIVPPETIKATIDHLKKTLKETGFKETIDMGRKRKTEIIDLRGLIDLNQKPDLDE